MPNVELFADFDLGDDVALERFLDAHNRKHVVLARTTGLKGGDLMGPVNGDWMLRHAARHAALAADTKVALSSADTKALALGGKWKTQQQLIDWMDLHSRHHLKLDRQLGLRG